MAEQITYSGDSRQAILQGVYRLAEAMNVTLGPRGRNFVSARLLTKSRLSGGGVQCYGSPGVNRASLIELAAPIGAMPWNGSSASFCSPAAAAAVISGSSNSAGLLIAKDSGDGVNAVATGAMTTFG
jgi:hypothetical protein